jgi:hypothetical protein
LHPLVAAVVVVPVAGVVFLLEVAVVVVPVAVHRRRLRCRVFAELPRVIVARAVYCVRARAVNTVVVTMGTAAVAVAPVTAVVVVLLLAGRTHPRVAQGKNVGGLNIRSGEADQPIICLVSFILYIASSNQTEVEVHPVSHDKLIAKDGLGYRGSFIAVLRAGKRLCVRDRREAIRRKTASESS